MIGAIKKQERSRGRSVPRRPLLGLPEDLPGVN